MRLRAFLATLSAMLILGLAAGPSALAFSDHGGKGNKEGSSSQTSGDEKKSETDTTRGKSGSTPDQDGTGMDRGIDNNDKTADGADGNNGCGNDADREDDNNGWCGRKPTPTPTGETAVRGTRVTSTETVIRFRSLVRFFKTIDVDAWPAELRSLVLTIRSINVAKLNASLSNLTTAQRDALTEMARKMGIANAPAGTAVLGTRVVSSDTAPAIAGGSAVSGGIGSLATTGAGILTLAIMGAGSLGAGVLFLRRRLHH